MSTLDTQTLEVLRRHDTPTICNAIEVAEGKRGFSNFTRKTMLYSSPSAGPIVGFARTAKIAGIFPASATPERIRQTRIEYFRHMAAGPRPAVAVVQDSDGPDCIAAWWGEVHAAVHKGLGVSGAVTNGVMRDLDDMDSAFAVLAGSVGPSHAHCHVTQIGGRVEIMGLTVKDGDLIHADQHGAIVIPADIAPQLPGAIDHLLATEQIVLDAARSPGFDIEQLETAWAEFEKART